MVVRSAIGDGVVLNVPEGVEIVAPGGRRRRGGAGTEQSAGDLVAAALGGAGFEVAADVELKAGLTAVAGRAGLDLTVTAGESAVVLVQEPGGLFRWSYPSETVPLPARRGAGGETLLRFDLATSEAESASPGRRGLPGRVAAMLDGARIRVLRFVATRGIDIAVDRLEGGVPSGLVILGPEAAEWTPTPRKPDWPTNRPARVLLMVHGTFSTTLGSFVGLTRTAQGRRFLELARQRYDVILGFDHPTLAQTVEENAAAMMAALNAVGLPSGSTIDAVAYSRGGLVYRVFAEEVAAQERDDLVFGTAVFVGCTNGGTNLASPANWEAMTDIYLNVILAASGLLGVLNTVAASAVMAGVRALGQLVKIIPQVAITDRRVPGLASMLPGGETVARLNAAREQSSPTRYHAITSSFRASPDAGDSLGRAFAEFLVDRVTDRLFDDANDLVVHVSSMTEFGGRTGRLGAGPEAVFGFGEGDAMFHTRYFDVDETPDRLIAWFGLTPPEPPQRRIVVGAGSPTDRGVIGFGIDGGGERVGRDRLVDRSADGAPSPSTDRMRTKSAPAAAGGRARRGGWGTEAPPPIPRVGAAPPTAAEAPDTSKEAARHFAAETLPLPRLDTPCAVYVSMSADILRVAAGGASATTAEAVPVNAEAEISVMLIPRRNCDVIGREVKAFPAGQSESTLRFEIQGREAGPADLLVEIRQGAAVLASLVLAPVFASPSETLRVEQVASVRSPGQEIPTMLRIYEIQQADKSLKLKFDLSGSNPNVSILDHVELRPGLDVSSFVAMFLANLENAWNISGKQYQKFVDRLADTSIVAANDLLPRSIRKALWDHRDTIEAVQIISEQPSIPWELLYITDPDGKDDSRNGFLSEWGAIRWMYNARWPGPTLALDGASARMIVPQYVDPALRLAGAADEREMLQTIFPGITEVEADSSVVAKFLGAEAAGCSLIHFACHGEAAQRAVLQSDLLMSGGTDAGGAVVRDQLSADQVKVRSRFAEDAPSGLVFINACQTGRSGEGIAGVAGFADSFIRPHTGRGAAAFVGALWSVDDRLALVFARTFYEHLNAGETLNGAVAAAREACKSQGDFSWLAYTVYGNPMARLTKSS